MIKRTYLEEIALNQANEFRLTPSEQCDHVAYMAYTQGFNYAMSLVESHSIYEHATGKMDDKTFEFIMSLVKLGERK